MRYQLKLPEFGRWHTLTLKHKINQITFLHKMGQLGTFYRTTLLLLLLSTLGRTQNPKHGHGHGYNCNCMKSPSPPNAAKQHGPGGNPSSMGLVSAHPS